MGVSSRARARSASASPRFFFLMNRRARRRRSRASFAAVHRPLLNKYYDRRALRRDRSCSRCKRVSDRRAVEGASTPGSSTAPSTASASFVRGSAALLRMAQTGSIRTYAASLVPRRRAGARLLPDAVMSVRAPTLVPERTRMLSLIVFLPLAGALRAAARAQPGRVARRPRPLDARWRSRSSSFAATLALWAGFDPDAADFQFVERLRVDPGLRHRLPTSASTASACCSSSSPAS